MKIHKYKNSCLKEKKENVSQGQTLRKKGVHRGKEMKNRKRENGRELINPFSSYLTNE